MGFAVRIYTLSFLLQGEVEENTAFMGWLNNVNKKTIDLTGVEAIPLIPGTKIPGLAQPSVTLPKSQVLGIAMLDEAGVESIQLPDRKEPVVLYTPRFIIQASMRPTGDMPINNLFNVAGGEFFPTTGAHLYALIPTATLPTESEELLILNKGLVDFYHPMP